jgi:hypothetical protein
MFRNSHISVPFVFERVLHDRFSDLAPYGRISTPPWPPEEFGSLKQMRGKEKKTKGKAGRAKGDGGWNIEMGSCQIKSRQFSAGVE